MRWDFANSLYPDQAQQYLGPDLDQTGSKMTLMVFLKECLEKINVEKKVSIHEELPTCIAKNPLLFPFIAHGNPLSIFILK